MLKCNFSRYDNYIIQSLPVKNSLPHYKLVCKIRFAYKRVLVNSFYLKRQQINLYRTVVVNKSTNYFLSNVMAQKRFFDKTDRRVFFAISNIYSFYKNSYSRDQYLDFYTLFFKIFPRLPLVNFQYYWLTTFIAPYVRTYFYYVTNITGFFSNQKLIRQPVLILSRTINKENVYSNHLKIFKGIVVKRELNSLFFFQSVYHQLFNSFGKYKFHKKSYFFNYILYMHGYHTKDHLRLDR